MGFKAQLVASFIGLATIAHVSPVFAQSTFVAPKKAAAQEDELRLASLDPSDLKAAVARSSAVNQRSGRIWCVPFAREVSGINLSGNAKTWWDKADGVYAKGKRPVVGSVLNFRGTRKMPMGHVAVVSKVVDERQVLVDQANWIRNCITKDTLVVDVSAQNDWSQVRVANADGTLGRTNPVYGFIYR